MAGSGSSGGTDGGQVIEAPAQLAGAVVRRERQARECAHARRFRREACEPGGVAAILPGERGQERFNIYCAPCHGALGDGPVDTASVETWMQFLRDLVRLS